MELVKDVLSESEKFFWYVLDATDDAVLLTDDDGFLSYVSPNATGLFGLCLEEVWQRGHISALLGEALFDPAELKRAGTIRDIVFPFPLAGGEMRTLRINVRAVDLREGSILYSCRDITEVKKAEKVLREDAQIKDEFISMAGHELRTPLTAIQGYAELLLRHLDLDAETRQHSLATIFEKAQELSQITDDLLDLSRLETAPNPHQRKTVVEAKNLVERVTQKVLRKIPRHRLDKRLPEFPIRLFVDESRMERALEHLLENAVKFSSPHGLITLCGRQEGGDFFFQIEDEGIGMSPEQVDKAFDKFYRADSSDSAIPGLGLGLSVAKKIVEEHGGRIWLESTPGKGTRVLFSIPFAEDITGHE